MAEVETFTVNGYTVRLMQDERESGNPREGSNLGVMLANGHKRYTLGDELFKGGIPEYDGAATIVEELVADGRLNGAAVMASFKARLGAKVVLPLFLLDHSGLSMRTGPFGEDPGGWDSGIVGFIFDTPRTREEMGFTELWMKRTEDAEAKLTEALRSEVSAYDEYLRGEVYQYVIEDPTGDVVDSCGGLLGYEYAKQEAVAAAEGESPVQWCVISGDLMHGLSAARGPYPDRAGAEAAAEGGLVLPLRTP